MTFLAYLTGVYVVGFLCALVRFGSDESIAAWPSVIMSALWPVSFGEIIYDHFRK